MISAQTLVSDLFTREILVGSPPSSSKSTSRFWVGFSQERGRWYLEKIVTSVSICNLCFFYYVQSRPTIFELAGHNRVGTSVGGSFQHNYIHCSYQWHKQSSIVPDSHRLPKVGLCPCYSCPKPTARLHQVHQNRPAQFECDKIQNARLLFDDTLLIFTFFCLTVPYAMSKVAASGLLENPASSQPKGNCLKRRDS